MTMDERIGQAETILYELIHEGIDSDDLAHAVFAALESVRIAGRVARRVGA